ncbi:MAG: AAA family ATPase [Spirosomaceae bacterium]|jgi:hypothetical protein|nr:AAA family ATPase [Spirosomataceae bacterium]
MIYRKITEKLDKWRLSSRRKPLILRGARQVGKTTTVHEFSKKYAQYIYVNLERDEFFAIFNENHSLDIIVEKLFFKTKQDPRNNDTLLFIDEIQVSPKAINLLRYFYEDYPQYHVIAAGSLLETILEEKVTIPVGRVSYMVMRPICFEEYLHTKNHPNLLEQYLKLPYDAFAFDILQRYFHEYAQVGGMPEVLNHYVENQTLFGINDIYQEIVTSYINDVDKYARNATMVQVLRYAIEHIGVEAGKRIKFQNFANSNYRSREVGESLKMLERSLLIHLIYPTVSSSIPIFSDTKKSPRLQMLDTGLMSFSAGITGELIGVKNLSDVYKGRILEHIVGQELLAQKFEPLDKLHFWTSEKVGSEAEIDFIIQRGFDVIPIEVKSGASGHLKSLMNFMDTVNHHWAVRLWGKQLDIHKAKTTKGKEFTLLNLPYFLAGRLEQYIDWFMQNYPQDSQN